jgi:flagellar biosynthesis protein FlhB
MAAKGTEEATPKRKREARREGRIAKSGEISTWAIVLAFTMILPWAFSKASTEVSRSLNNVTLLAEEPSPEAIRYAMGDALKSAFSVVLAIGGVIALIALVATMAQIGFILTAKPLKPNFKRLNPVGNIKSILGPKGLWETVKQALRAVILLVLGWAAIQTLLKNMVMTAGQDIFSSLQYSGKEIMAFVRVAAIASFALAVGDYGVQKAMLRRELRMTRQEIRDEFRQSEGDPMVKGRIRQLQRELARQRMLEDVPSSTVVIVNPTHYSVALKWGDGMNAPLVTASGTDRVAAQIKARAIAAGIPVVEAPPLARALHKYCQVGDSIPSALFEAVARVLAAIAKTKSTMGAPLSLDVDVPVDVPKPRRRRRR